MYLLCVWIRLCLPRDHYTKLQMTGIVTILPTTINYNIGADEIEGHGVDDDDVDRGCGAVCVTYAFHSTTGREIGGGGDTATTRRHRW